VRADDDTLFGPPFPMLDDDDFDYLTMLAGPAVVDLEDALGSLESCDDDDLVWVTPRGD
jgi:hypothetical protein